VGGAEGGRFTDSTEDSGPMKPGNSVEEKPLTTGERSRVLETGRQRTRRLRRLTHN
jgi:hypothetical protein